jgi:hypothetical protein
MCVSFVLYLDQGEGVAGLSLLGLVQQIPLAKQFLTEETCHWLETTCREASRSSLARNTCKAGSDQVSICRSTRTRMSSEPFYEPGPFLAAIRRIAMSKSFHIHVLLQFIIAAFPCLLDHSNLLGEEGPRVSLATFVAEVAPPVGHPLQGGLGVKPVATVADPLYAQGFVLLGAGKPLVLCSVDWCGIGDDAHDRWREALAEAAGTIPERVLVCAIHQHDAPMADLEAERLIAAQKTGRIMLDLSFHEKAVRSVADAVKGSLKDARPVTHIGTGEAQVEKVASNRRILGNDGKVELFRGSATKDPKAKEAPEGLIDPWLKTLSFWNGDKPLASISVYATHPMSYYGQGEVSADFAGIARRRRQADDPGVLHFYANGCGGNLAPGKYNDGSPAVRIELAERLYRAWKSAWNQTKKHPLVKVAFRSVPLRLEPKESAGFTAKELSSVLTGPTSTFDERVRVAYALSWRKQCETKRSLDLPVLDFGVAQLLLLPGEPFVEYQLFAQQQRPESFVLTLGYGDYGPVYIPIDKAYAEGGYEPGQWSFVGPGVEKTLKDAIASGLEDKKRLNNN